MKTLTRTAGTLARPGAVAVAAAASARRTRSLTLMGWHRLDHEPGGLSTTPADFRAQLDVLEEWGAHVLPLAEAARLLARDELPDRAVALTFDDGYLSVLEHAWPELCARGLPATMFAVSGYLDGRRRFPWDHDLADSHVTRLANGRALREAADQGLDIGSHTMTHPWLPHLSPVEVAKELAFSRSELEDLTGRPVTTFAYPTGGYDARVRRQVAEAGYDVAITVDRGGNRPGQSPWSLRRAFAFDRPHDFRLQLEGAYTWMRPLERWRTRGGPPCP